MGNDQADEDDAFLSWRSCAKAGPAQTMISIRTVKRKMMLPLRNTDHLFNGCDAAQNFFNAVTA